MEPFSDLARPQHRIDELSALGLKASSGQIARPCPEREEEKKEREEGREEEGEGREEGGEGREERREREVSCCCSFFQQQITAIHGSKWAGGL